ncbi:hypothetical protein [Brevundimonas sp.]|uniref:hypothetical protein n=1 Tax=Brevundimonas sp. TaxID=1871086 RepID=UPI003A922F27
MFLTILLAGAINAGPSPVDWLQQLQAEPFERSMPKAVIIQTREFAASTAISLYETRSADGTGTESSIWHARREVRTGDDRVIAWTSTVSCAPLFSVIVALERLALPHVELRQPRADQFPTPRPVMGALHQSHLVWVTAWDSGNAPVQLTLESLGSGPPKQIYDLVDAQLSACW